MYPFICIGGWRTGFTLGYRLPGATRAPVRDGGRVLHVAVGAAVRGLATDVSMLRVVLPAGAQVRRLRGQGALREIG
jgi:hypothetical protein